MCHSLNHSPDRNRGWTLLVSLALAPVVVLLIATLVVTSLTKRLTALVR